MSTARALESVAVKSANIVTAVEGEGPALVMLPSYGRDALDDFDGVAGRLAAAGWKVLRPQPRGVAGSQGPMRDLDLRALAEDVAGVVEALADGPAVVLGHAFGSFVARVLMVEHAELVRGVILAAAGATKVAPDVNETPFIAGDPTRPEAERLAALEKAFFAPGHDPRIWLKGWYPATLAMQRAAVQATHLEPYWYAGRAPLLEINARFDPFKPPEFWGELREHVGDRATTVLIEDASHALFPEQPERIAGEIVAWLARQFDRA